MMLGEDTSEDAIKKGVKAAAALGYDADRMKLDDKFITKYRRAKEAAAEVDQRHREYSEAVTLREKFLKEMREKEKEVRNAAGKASATLGRVRNAARNLLTMRRDHPRTSLFFPDEVVND